MGEMLNQYVKFYFTMFSQAFTPCSAGGPAPWGSSSTTWRLDPSTSTRRRRGSSGGSRSGNDCFIPNIVTIFEAKTRMLFYLYLTINCTYVLDSILSGSLCGLKHFRLHKVRSRTSHWLLERLIEQLYILTAIWIWPTFVSQINLRISSLQLRRLPRRIRHGPPFWGRQRGGPALIQRGRHERRIKPGIGWALGLPTPRNEKNAPSLVKKMPQMDILLQKGFWKNAQGTKMGLFSRVILHFY